MPDKIRVIAFDADDTLWHNEVLYNRAQERFERLLAPYDHGRNVIDELYETEMANLPEYGYGIKSFGLSMIETAVRLTAGRVSGPDVLAIVDIVKDMKKAPVHLLDHVAEVIPALAKACTLMVITKGDLLDQEKKVRRSGLAPCFDHIEVVSSKTPEVYRGLLERLKVGVEEFLMVGNSLRSDVLPVVALGGHAVHIPYEITWAHEEVDLTEEDMANGYVELEHMGLLPEYVEWLCQKVE